MNGTKLLTILLGCSISFLVLSGDKTRYEKTELGSSEFESKQKVTHKFTDPLGLSEAELVRLRSNVLVQKDMIVLKDASNLTPIKEFFGTEDPKEDFANSFREKMIDQFNSGKSKMDSARSTSMEEKAQKLLDNMFPISPDKLRSTHLMVPVVKNIPQITQPLFIIGDNQASLDWLVNNKDELISLGAEGILTKVKNHGDYKRIQAMARPLRIQPINADFLYEEFGVNGYPLLITRDGFFQ